MKGIKLLIENNFNKLLDVTLEGITEHKKMDMADGTFFTDNVMNAQRVTKHLKYYVDIRQCRNYFAKRVSVVKNL